MMTTNDLEQAILAIIKKVYCKEYTGRLKVTEIPGGYRLDLGMNNDERPISIAAESSDFLNFVEKELRDRSLDMTEYFTAIQLYDER